MTRPPRARKKVLEAARRIVETRGAGHLTFDTLAEESGVTRGGITYHFPTKEDLLRALIEVDIEDWNAAMERLGGDSGLPPRPARLLGHVRTSLAEEDDAHKRFVTGMVSAAMHDPSLLDPVRRHIADEFRDWAWDDADLQRYLFLAAADGLFWNGLFNVSPLPPDVRPRMAAMIEREVLALHERLGPPAHCREAARPASAPDTPTSARRRRAPALPSTPNDET